MSIHNSTLRLFLYVLLSLATLFTWGQQAALPISTSSKDSSEVKEVSVAELVISAKKNPFALLSQLDINLRPIQSSQDVLRSVPGLFIAQHAGGGKAEQMFLRGFDIDHGTDIALSVDGLPVNMVSHAHGQGYSDLHFLIPELIQQVEYGKGPFDAAHGNFATAGFVDFSTPTRLKNNAVKLSVGQYKSYRGLLMANLFQEESAQQAYLVADYNQSQGYFENPQDFNRLNLFGKYNTWLGENTRLKASAAFFTSRWNASGQVPVRAIEDGSISPFGAIDPTEGGNTQRAHAEVELTHLLSSQASITAQAYAINYDFELFSNFTFFLQDSVNGDQIRQAENRWISGGKIVYKHQQKTKLAQFTTDLGVQLRYDAVRDNLLAHTFRRDSILNFKALGDVNELNVSAFWQERIQFSPRWELNLGLRYDLFNRTYTNKLEQQAPGTQSLQGQINPKLSLRFNANEQLSLFVQSGTGFHANDTRLFVANSRQNFLPRAYGLDAGMVVKPFQRLFLQAVAWRLDLEQEFVYVGDEGIVEAGGRTRRYGLEFSARWQPLNWLYADADVTYAVARSKDEPQGANYIPLAPGLTATGGLSAQLTPNFRLGLRYRQLTDRPANEDFSLVAEGYEIVDLVMQYRWKRFEWGLNIENLLNSEWKETQFETESRLRGEANSVSEIHFTPGSPFFARLSMQVNF
jgi:outer membrane receptor protein involved in Fe transport